jgi:hypothetical protein
MGAPGQGLWAKNREMWQEFLSKEMNLRVS